MLKEGEVIGIIHFQNNAHIALPLTKKDGSNQKRILQALVPKMANNKTSNIWNGILFIFLEYLFVNSNLY